MSDSARSKEARTFTAHPNRRAELSVDGCASAYSDNHRDRESRPPKQTRRSPIAHRDREDPIECDHRRRIGPQQDVVQAYGATRRPCHAARLVPKA
jgi:hypothetical protein